MKRLIYLSLSAIVCLLLFSGCSQDEPVKASFSFAVTEWQTGEVQFFNASENAQSYLWNFGDGQTSTEEAPRHIYNGEFPFTATLTARRGKETNTFSMQIPLQIIALKPNIYLYPQKQLSLHVSVSFPKGGQILESIPLYGTGWNITVDPNGKIDQQYDYLFYESGQPDMFQYRDGWCIAQNDLKTFFEKNLTSYNFAPTEIKDFTDYWIPKLKDANYYRIFPQINKDIDPLIQLNFSVKPDFTGRLFYAIVKSDQYTELPEPRVNPFTRNGFYVMEWGVVRK